MVSIAVATRAGLLIARQGTTWAVDQYLRGRSSVCVAVDPYDSARVYCGTATAGLFRSRNSGRHWEPVGAGINHPTITAVAVGQTQGAEGLGIIYAGTEPSAVFRSETGGDDWVDLAGLRALPSASTWSFPPRPHTHHVRWIEADVSSADRVFVAIEAGALVRTFDGGRTWHDRVRGGPYDTHRAATHPLAPGRIYSAAGDGYFESADGGDSWRSPEEGLQHRYLVDVAVDPTDPDTVVVSATDGPFVAYRPRSAEAYVYRRTGLERWEQAMSGLPEARGMTASRFATHASEPGVIYAANNRGLFRSEDAGRTWNALDVAWPEPGLADGVEALACLPE
ncbi:MAG: WD40/YVTN/BNR-like repeat-containing protein [Vicinamibacteraceae bacterium]